MTFWRIYLHGLLLLVVVGVSVFAVGRAFGGPRPGAMERVVRWMAREIEPQLDDRQALQQVLEENATSLRTSFGVFTPRGEPLALAGDDPPPPPRRGGIRGRGVRHLPADRLVVAPIGRPPRALLVARIPRWSDDWTRPAAVIGAVLAALAIGSIPLARSIAAPIEHLTRTVRRFGEGDLSARAGGRRARGEVGELQRAFDESAERIEGLIRSEKELIANISHELRTPLARIRVALELAEEGGGAGRWLHEIETDLAELDQMIEDVLTTARLDVASPGGVPPIHRASLPAASWIGAAADRFVALHPDRELRRTIEGELPILDADPPLLRRALSNLLDNAAKYSDGPIDLVAEVQGETLVVEVIDRGIGIAPADLPHLFSPFYRTDRSRTRGTGGIGLGLALTRRIVEAHGGTVDAESDPGKRTVFRIILPRSG